MQITVVGAGIIGISTAHALAQEGHQVTLVERHPGPGEGTSYANGGQLSYSYVAPLAGPGVLSHVPGWLLRRDSPLRLRPSLDPALLRWGLRFIAACNRERADRTTRELLALSFYSRARMEALRAAAPDLSFSFARRGKLVLHRDAAAFASARAQVGYQATLGCEQYALSADETIAREPALAGVRSAIVGAIYTPDEDVADCHQLCVGLFNRLRAMSNVSLRFNTGVESLWLEGRRVRGVRTAHEQIAADAVVVAAGVASAKLLGPLCIDPGLYPLKGYSISLPLGESGAGSDGAPVVSVTDAARKIVYARIGGTLRVAGMADLVGWSDRLDTRRVQTLYDETRALFPAAMRASDAGADAAPWAGMRPATPTGVPVVGPSPVDGLWLNVGHGALGLTLALGSAGLLADLIARRQPAIAPAPYALTR
ncbi:D-amino acid dehydrogenase [Ralstonia solanacearum]|uniref:D-amino acid dehydrogenase n=1 Tax=Ralstonia solanacearum TaxID=305 RepID=A0AAE3T755_RALSL|nr:D-amino acid dehydrogenase [Ralstonia solanacearum]MBB6581512.1 D-amino acid dehydrogenase [Ralstonia solanacearum]MDB0524638.1 D-amino acid dehydrogenase [Ralstonia solanacearum]